MIKIEKFEDEYGKQAILHFENNDAININYYGNNDLYFTPESDDLKDSYHFEIDALNDNDLYNLFNSLFYNIENEIKKFKIIGEYPLIKNNTIKWVSDDDPYNIASKMIISKEEDKILIDFKDGKNIYGDETKTVRVCTDGSRYGYLFVPFMKLYNDLFEIDPNYHQYNFDEYMLMLKRKEK